MSWLSSIFGGSSPASDPARIRADAWATALRTGKPPEVVVQRLQGQATPGSGVPWTSSMLPAELLLARSHGLRPVGMVSGTCWFRYARSWTEGHASGWTTALDRLRAEAAAAGANAVVDVRMRTAHAPLDSSMDFTLLGTAVRIDGLPPSPHPVVATVPAFEFVRLAEAGIVPLGIAVGAYYDWLTDDNSNGWSYGRIASQLRSWNSQPIPELTGFWENARRVAHAQLREHARSQGGSGVLADVQFGQLLRFEVDKCPDRYLARHIVIGTVVHSRAGETFGADVTPVIDMAGDFSTARPMGTARHPYRGASLDQEGSI